VGSLPDGLAGQIRDQQFRTKTAFPILFGSFFAGLPMATALLVIFTVTLFTLAPFGVAMMVLGYRLGGRDKWKDTVRPGKGTGGRGNGWVMGGGSGRSGSGGSSGGGSFGGGSSGGGASRSW